MRKKTSIIFIYCPNKSGSTLLDYILNNHEEIISGGEFDLKRENCNCLKKIDDCIFWKKIIDKKLIKNIKSNNEKYNYNFKIYRKIYELYKPKHIIDNSKDFKKIKKIIYNEDFDTKVIFISRNPVNIAASNKRKYLNDNLIGRLPLLNLYFQMRVLINLFLIRKNVISIIKYEDLVKNPLIQSNKIFLKLGLKPILNISLNKETFHNLGGDSSFWSPKKKHEINKILNKNNNTNYLSTFEKILCYFCSVPILIFRYFIKY